MCQVCPTVTATDSHRYRQELEVASSLSRRVHIDLMDKEFTGAQSISLAQAWWDEGYEVDIHLMFQRPEDELMTLIARKPTRVIVHSESDGDLVNFATELKKHGISPGLALLQGTQIKDVLGIIQSFDSVLIFSGNLGHHGGLTDLSLLDKIIELRQSAPDIEVAWDGGINNTNLSSLVDGGVEVLNVGGYIQNAEDPANSYQTLMDLLKS